MHMNAVTENLAVGAAAVFASPTFSKYPGAHVNTPNNLTNFVPCHDRIPQLKCPGTHVNTPNQPS